MRFLRLLILFTWMIISLSCDGDGERLVKFGTVRFEGTGEVAKGVGLEFKVYEQHGSGRGVVESVVVKKVKGETNGEGKYDFNVDVTDVKRPFRFGISLVDKGLIVTDEYTPCLTSTGVGQPPSLPETNEINFSIDDATYLSVELRKVNLDQDSIQYSYCYDIEGASSANPTKTFVKRMPFFYSVNGRDIKYVLIKDNGEQIENWINDISMIKHDTTFVVVEY